MESVLLALGLTTATALSPAPLPATELETVAELAGPMPAGITVAPSGWIFVNYPQRGDAPAFAVAELRNGRPVPYPHTDLNAPESYDPARDLLSVQSGVADADDQRWILDTGAPAFTAPVVGGAATRRLSNYPSTMLASGFTPVVAGKPMMNRPGPAFPWLVGSDGIEISPDGETLYCGALSSLGVYAVPTAMVRDLEVSEADLAATVQDLAEKAPSDDMVSDALGRLYPGDYEDGTIRRRSDETWQVLVDDPWILCPDTLPVGTDGYLYFTANQLNWQSGFHRGRDLRQSPHLVFRVRIDAEPVLLN